MENQYVAAGCITKTIRCDKSAGSELTPFVYSSVWRINDGAPIMVWSPGATHAVGIDFVPFVSPLEEARSWRLLLMGSKDGKLTFMRYDSNELEENKYTGHVFLCVGVIKALPLQLLWHASGQAGRLHSSTTALQVNCLCCRITGRQVHF